MNDNEINVVNSTKPFLLEINEFIRERVINSTDKIKNSIIDREVEKEIGRRTQLLQDLFLAINQFKKELNKFKPDLTSYNADGSVNNESWSKKALDDKNKAFQKIKKAEDSFEKAINKNDYQNIEQIIKELSVKQEGNQNSQSNQKKDVASKPDENSDV